MTGFASLRGAGQDHDWMWEVRSVNGKGLDLRLRLPDGIDGLEPLVRAAVGQAVARGNVSVNLKLGRIAGDEGPRLSGPGLAAALAAVTRIETEALARGIVLAPTRASDILTLRGVTEQGSTDLPDTGPLRAALLADLTTVLADFNAVRAAEGAALGAVIAGQLDRIAALTAAAKDAAEARRPEVAAALTTALARVLDAAPGTDSGRIAQELAMLAVKADVTEEIDRLGAHIAAARALLTDSAPVGRKFDFLSQEFTREANTLCSKSGSTTLTALGLDLKHTIDQMREQIQNVE